MNCYFLKAGLTALSDLFRTPKEKTQNLPPYPAHNGQGGLSTEMESCLQWLHPWLRESTFSCIIYCRIWPHQGLLLLQPVLTQSDGGPGGGPETFPECLGSDTTGAGLSPRVCFNPQLQLHSGVVPFTESNTFSCKILLAAQCRGGKKCLGITFSYSFARLKQGSLLGAG